MFGSCIYLQNIDGLRNWDVSNGKDFSFMFSYCEKLKNIDGLRNWNVSNGK
jgi:surface protein